MAYTAFKRVKHYQDSIVAQDLLKKLAEHEKRLDE